jgi:3-isopropylmalate/(R)-2-methylmalate dehydratase small subunit
MKPFDRHRGKVAPLDRANVDTDAILPKQFMKSIERTGFGPHLFDGLRYLDAGEPGMDCSTRALNPGFVLNQPRYRDASILLARRNFGCGSSREHAPWALEQYGFRVLIAPSFADIFFSNCFKNGLLPITLSEETVDSLFDEEAQQPDFAIEVDLPSQTITTPAGQRISFSIEPTPKEHLLKGLDEIGATLTLATRIRQFEADRRRTRPWFFDDAIDARGRQHNNTGDIA